MTTDRTFLLRNGVVMPMVFTATSHDVSDVWVQGRQLVEDGSLISVDVKAVATRAQGAAEELFERRRNLPGPTLSPATTLNKSN